MNDTNLILAQNPNFNFIGIKFLDGNNPTIYYYKTFQKFEVGDRAVVDSPVSGLTVVEVMEIDCILEVSGRDNGAYKWIVQKVNQTDYLKAQNIEKEVTRHVNSMRWNKIRKEAKDSLQESIGDAGLNELIMLVNDEKLAPDAEPFIPEEVVVAEKANLMPL